MRMSRGPSECVCAPFAFVQSPSVLSKLSILIKKLMKILFLKSGERYEVVVTLQQML